MERIRSGFDFIFSSYKRAAGILFVLALLLAIPVTVNFLGQQQDVRQEAAGPSLCTQLQDELNRVQATGVCQSNPAACNLINAQMVRAGCPVTTTIPTSQPSPTGQICAQVITRAQNTTTNECTDFPTSCLPTGWVANSGCTPLDLTPTLTPIPTLTPTPTLAATPTSGSNNQCALHSRGDANCDGKVNTDDFNIWRDEFLGNSNTKTSDFNNDIIINTDDFNIWRDGFLDLSIPH